jgi:hypothetical protein
VGEEAEKEQSKLALEERRVERLNGCAGSLRSGVCFWMLFVSKMDGALSRQEQGVDASSNKDVWER